jgi:hypothetical protein
MCHYLLLAAAQDLQMQQQVCCCSALHLLLQHQAGSGHFAAALEPAGPHWAMLLLQLFHQTLLAATVLHQDLQTKLQSRMAALSARCHRLMLLVGLESLAALLLSDGPKLHMQRSGPRQSWQ